MPKAKISREAWVNWRFSAQHEVEDLDYSYDIIESFKENGTFKLELDLDDLTDPTEDPESLDFAESDLVSFLVVAFFFAGIIQLFFR